jgi:cell division protein FtsZ
MLQFEHNDDSIAKILVVGIGGGGGNAVNRMIKAGLSGVNFIAINTDKQALDMSAAETKLQIGDKVTGGLGAGGDPQKGTEAAEESIEDIKRFMSGVNMVFITAGMGGGTGTGGAPVVAKVAKDLGILTVGVVTKPFSFEGKKRKDQAELGISYLKKYVDSLVVVPNDRLMLMADDNTSMLEAFDMADEVLKQGVEGISAIISETALINLDFADVKTIMKDRGLAHMGIGSGEGENKVDDAVKDAIESPLLETSINGAKAIILNISGGYDLGMLEVTKAADQIEQAADNDAIVIFGAGVREELQDKMVITVIATGFEDRAVDSVIEHTGKGLAMNDDMDETTEDDDSEYQGKDEGMPDFGTWNGPSNDDPEQESLLQDYDSNILDNDFTIPGFLKKD